MNVFVGTNAGSYIGTTPGVPITYVCSQIQLYYGEYRWTHLTCGKFLWKRTVVGRKSKRCIFAISGTPSFHADK